MIMSTIKRALMAVIILLSSVIAGYGMDPMDPFDPYVPSPYPGAPTGTLFESFPDGSFATGNYWDHPYGRNAVIHGPGDRMTTITTDPWTGEVRIQHWGDTPRR